MDDLISRQAAITLPIMPKEYRKHKPIDCDDAYEQGWGDCQSCIGRLPTADLSEYCDKLWKTAYERGKAEAHAKGKWLAEDCEYDVFDIAGERTWAIKATCSECDFTMRFIEGHGMFDYCPNCGAKMEESE